MTTVHRVLDGEHSVSLLITLFVGSLSSSASTPAFDRRLPAMATSVSVAGSRRPWSDFLVKSQSKSSSALRNGAQTLPEDRSRRHALQQEALQRVQPDARR